MQEGSFHVRSIMEDRKGNLWIGFNGMGILKYDGKKIVNFTGQQKLEKQYTKGNSLERVFSIGEDTRRYYRKHLVWYCRVRCIEI
ncbi:two-component regulator propeller domain-containing protein [Flavobacterium lipolyticum]|uniref:two-component regulator propeller domain-containing protein n=1 Tax=Flavobacterium lipolyticum TaxID=2893754 RepID=UPI003D172031